MKRITIALVALAFAAPVSGQAGAMGDHQASAVTGSGELPQGWMVRFDPVRVRPNRPTPPTPTVADIHFRTMGAGLHATSGPAAIYYQDGEVASGDYTVSATFSQSRSMGHEAYGLVIGGSNLQESTQNYLYFLVRPADGGILINHRMSDDPPTKLVDWEVNAAVAKEDAEGKATNSIAVQVMGDMVHFMVNGRMAKMLTRDQLHGASTDGLYGFRINHNLDIHISDFRLTN